MPQPTSRESHPVDALLSNYSNAYIQDLTQFIAAQASTIVPVDKETGKYMTYPKGRWFVDEAKRRGDSQESAGSGYKLSTGSFSCETFALHKDIGDITRANSAAILNPERDAAAFVAQNIAQRRERDWQEKFFASGIWGTSFTPSVLWDTLETSDPIDDVEVGKQTILSTTGRKPNVFILGYKVFRVLKHHPDIVDRYKYTSAGVLTEELLAQVFGVERVLVASGIKNTATEGATDSFSFIQGDTNALLAHVSPLSGTMTPTAMATFIWTGVSDGLGLEVGTSQFPMRHLGRNHIRIESQISFDNVVIGSDLGYFFSGATT